MMSKTPTCTRPSPHSPLPRACTLDALSVGRRAVVVDVIGAGAVRQRLFDLGLLPGAKLELQRVAPSGDPLWIRLGNAQLALRRSEARLVNVL